MTEAPLRDRMVDLTATRDADLLDLTLLRTVREVLAAEEWPRLRTAPDGRSMAETGLREDARLPRTVAEIHDAATRAQLADVRGPGEVVQLQHDGRALLVYPMMEARGTRTCLRVGGTQAPGAADQPLLHGLARFLQNYRSLLDDAQRDALTGLRNGKTFDDMILRLCAANADGAQQDAVWLGIVDIDHFK
ncbi:hypothetical protein ACSBR9_24470, partial [Xanthomonas campestris]